MRLTSRKTTSWVAASAAVLALLLPLVPAAAQQAGREQGVSPVTTIDAGGAGPDFDLRTVARGFDLFAGADGAVSGLRMTGHMSAGLTNYGDCDNAYSTFRCEISRTVYVPSWPYQPPRVAPFYEIEWVAAAPPTEYRKIKQVAPSVGNATGGGWTGGYSARVLGRRAWFGPADHTLGTMFSGITTTMDGSCRDHSGFANGYWAAGYQLLPTSDCPETWGSDGWQGAHPIDQAGWQALFDARGDGFRFDFWRVPPGDQRLDRPFLGTRFHTYGETSDYSSDVLPNYGAVVPGGVGQPVVQGYPLGLLLHFDAFTFADPRVSDAYFVQVLIINRSQDVWGGGIDYDSLYLGFSIGAYFGNKQASRYALPDRGMVLYHGSNVQGPGGPCDHAYRNNWMFCNSGNSPTRGYGAGAVALMMLKSPLGDVRNKLFTRLPAGAPCTVGRDPFCQPGHPLRGDTLTFNRQAFGEYSSALNYTFFSGAKPTFGYLAANETLTNAGRDPGAQPDNTLWTVFRSEDWPTNKAHYNKYVPLASPPWDYNHDGRPDTLALDTCGRHGCAAVDSDTMPGGWLNVRGIMGGLQSFGPFKLAAGDTTALIYAMVGDGDSTALWGQIDAVTDLYLNFFGGPEAPPPVRVLSTAVTPGTDDRGTTTAPAVRILFSDAAETWVDPFLEKLADDLEAGPSGLYGMFVAENPWLADTLRARARHNLARLEIYKSCDGGATWTADADCLGDRAVDVDQRALGLGWQAYAVYDADPRTGDVPNEFTDAQVLAGRTYLYTIVGRTRGATVALDSAGVPITYTFAASTWNPLARGPGDSNVVVVYVPASRPAGYRAAAVAVTTEATATVPFAVSLSDNAVAGAYRAVFGTEIVVERDSNTATGRAVGSVVTVERRATVDVGGMGVDSVIRRATFVDDSPERFPVSATAVTELGTVVLGDTIRTTTVYGRVAQNTGLGFVLAEAGGRPVFGSTTLAAGQATPGALLGRADYPGFTVEADNTLQGTYETGFEAQRRGAQSMAELQLAPADTLVPRASVDADMVQWVETLSVRTAFGGGRYAVSWADDPFGVARGFVLDLANAAVTAAEVQAALAGRAVAATGVTDQTTADLLGVPQLELVAVRLPFTIRNVTFDRPVRVALLRRPVDRLVLGNGADTLAVAIPEDVWVPGDQLVLLEDVEGEATVGSPPRLIMATPTEPLRWTGPAVTFSSAVLGCEQGRASCNPVPLGTRGGTGYAPMRAGDETRFGYYVGFTPSTEYAFTVTAAVTGGQITAVTDSALRLIRVVPNPFVVYSLYQTSLAQGRVAFTHLPPVGTLRIYTVAGQLAQQITWEPRDLQGDGDLFWNLESLDAVPVNSGLYLWVLTAPSDPTNPASAPLHARGKLVIIR